MSTILGDMDRIKAIAKDFVEHYEKRVEEGANIVTGKHWCITELGHEKSKRLQDRKSTRLNSSHITRSRMPSSA